MNNDQRNSARAGADAIDHRVLSLDDIVVQRAGPLATQLDGEIVALNIERGNYYAMTGTGSRIWQLTAAPIAVGDVVRQLCGEFAVDPEVCRREVLAFAEDLRREELLTIVR